MITANHTLTPKLLCPVLFKYTTGRTRDYSYNANMLMLALVQRGWCFFSDWTSYHKRSADLVLSVCTHFRFLKDTKKETTWLCRPLRGLRSTRKKFTSFTFISLTLRIKNSSTTHSPNTTHHWHTRSSADCNEQSCCNISDTHWQKEWLNNCGRRRAKPQNYLARIKADYVIRRLLSTPRMSNIYLFRFSRVFFVFLFFKGPVGGPE